MIAIKTGLTAEQLMLPTPRELVAVKLKTSNVPLFVIEILMLVFAATMIIDQLMEDCHSCWRIDTAVGGLTQLLED